MAKKRKKHLSPTQLNMLSNCGEQYRRRYIEGEIIPPGAALLQGSAMHVSAADNFQQKVSSHKDKKIEDMVELADSVVQEKVRTEGIWLNPEEKGRGQTVIVEETRERARKFTQCHAQEQAPAYQPVLVEEKMLIELPGDFDLMGILDLASDAGVLVDLKTASRKKAADEADKSTQLTVYSAIYRRKTGEMPKGIQLDIVVQTAAGNVSRQVLTTERGRRDFEVLVNRINAAAKVIQAGAFAPAPPDSWLCDERWCGYSHNCPFFQGKTRQSQGD